jgi:hypothetical protein
MNLADALKSSDAQSEALARMTGFSASSVKDALAIWVALLIELGSGFGLYAATASGRSSGQTSGQKQERSETVLPQDEAPAGEIDRQPRSSLRNGSKLRGRSSISGPCPYALLQRSLPFPARQALQAHWESRGHEREQQADSCRSK